MHKQSQNWSGVQYPLKIHVLYITDSRGNRYRLYIQIEKEPSTEVDWKAKGIKGFLKSIYARFDPIHNRRPGRLRIRYLSDIYLLFKEIAGADTYK